MKALNLYYCVFVPFFLFSFLFFFYSLSLAGPTENTQHDFDAEFNALFPEIMGVDMDIDQLSRFIADDLTEEEKEFINEIGRILDGDTMDL